MDKEGLSAGLMDVRSRRIQRALWVETSPLRDDVEREREREKEKEGDGTVCWRGEGGVFPPRWGKVKEKLASCSRRMYCRHKPAQREGGRRERERERVVMEVWGAALLSWCYLTSPVKPRSFSSCFFKPQLLFVCVLFFFSPPPTF